eukprot:CAMPEP_0195104448 /NCGR_PEP_ID=MMETSP0448-20130528/73107_1 /TAXON_ID=66468 /ORGANISM="Heterocapsa triquestra, Strain CCMP 448" /LENGTH=56 /DNA_ID=CAMNT_0040140289 /DNA_START=26 /DNA_END=196 /DNA_ORIENTATION=-
MTHLKQGNVEKTLVVSAVVGALLGGSAGSAVAAFLPEQTLRIVFAAVLTGVGLKFL